MNIVNAVKRAEENPDTFYIPSQAERDNVQPGDFVKICIQDADMPGERFWCKVISSDISFGDITQNYAVEVDNDLVVYDIPLGSELFVNSCHIMDILKGGE